MAHVRSSRVAKKGWWWSCHARTAEGGGGEEEQQQKGFLAAAERADAAAIFVARAVQVCREPWQKNAKKQEQLGARHVMSLIIHRSAGNVVPCEARLPEQMLPGACDWGRRQPAFPPRSWDVVSASVRLWLCAVSGLVAPPVLGFPSPTLPSPWTSPGAQEPRSPGAKVGFAEAGCSPTFRLPPEVVSVRRVLGSGPIGRYWGRPGAPGHRLCCSGAAISAVSTWACSGVVPRGQDSQAGARRQAPGTRAPQILGRAGCEAAPGWWKSRRADFWRGLPWFCLGCRGAGLARWILPDPSIGTGSICSRVLELLWRLDWGPRACFLVLLFSPSLGASFGVRPASCSRQNLHWRAAWWEKTCRSRAPTSVTRLISATFPTALVWERKKKGDFDKEAAGFCWGDRGARVPSVEPNLGIWELP